MKDKILEQIQELKKRKKIIGCIDCGGYVPTGYYYCDDCYEMMR